MSAVSQPDEGLRRSLRNSAWSRHRVERVALRALRPAVIAVLTLVTAFPFLYIFMLSMRDLSSTMKEPWRVWPTPRRMDPERLPGGARARPRRADRASST